MLHAGNVVGVQDGKGHEEPFEITYPRNRPLQDSHYRARILFGADS